MYAKPHLVLSLIHVIRRINCSSSRSKRNICKFTNNVIRWPKSPKIITITKTKGRIIKIVINFLYKIQTSFLTGTKTHHKPTKIKTKETVAMRRTF